MIRNTIDKIKNKNARKFQDATGTLKLRLKIASHESMWSSNGFENKELIYKVKEGVIFEKKQLIVVFTDITASKRVSILEEVNEFKSQMMSAITRELKTPLNSIIGLNVCATE